MVYLIESDDYYKIGYTANLEQRIKSYNTCNPNFKIIDTRNGSKEDESALHTLCADFREKLEWFKKDPSVLYIWKTYFYYKENNEKKVDNNLTLLTKAEEALKSANKILNETQLARYNDMLFINNLKCLVEQEGSDKEIKDYIFNYIKENN
jgi:hypothetical protein